MSSSFIPKSDAKVAAAGGTLQHNNNSGANNNNTPYLAVAAPSAGDSKSLSLVSTIRDYGSKMFMEMEAFVNTRRRRRPVMSEADSIELAASLVSMCRTHWNSLETVVAASSTGQVNAIVAENNALRSELASSNRSLEELSTLLFGSHSLKTSHQGTDGQEPLERAVGAFPTADAIEHNPFASFSRQMSNLIDKATVLRRELYAASHSKSFGPPPSTWLEDSDGNASSRTVGKVPTDDVTLWKEEDVSIEILCRLAEHKQLEATRHMLTRRIQNNEMDGGFDVQEALREMSQDLRVQLSRCQKQLENERRNNITAAKAHHEEMMRAEARHESVTSEMKRRHAIAIEGLQTAMATQQEESIAHASHIWESIMVEYASRLSNYRGSELSRATAMESLKEVLMNERQKVEGIYDMPDVDLMMEELIEAEAHRAEDEGEEMSPENHEGDLNDDPHSVWSPENAAHAANLNKLLRGKQAEINILLAGHRASLRVKGLEWETVLRGVIEKYEAMLAHLKSHSPQAEMDTLRERNVRLEQEMEDLREKYSSLLKENLGTGGGTASNASRNVTATSPQNEQRKASSNRASEQHLANEAGHSHSHVQMIDRACQVSMMQAGVDESHTGQEAHHSNGADEASTHSAKLLSSQHTSPHDLERRFQEGREGDGYPSQIQNSHAAGDVVFCECGKAFTFPPLSPHAASTVPASVSPPLLKENPPSATMGIAKEAMRRAGGHEEFKNVTNDDVTAEGNRVGADAKAMPPPERGAPPTSASQRERSSKPRNDTADEQADNTTTAANTARVTSVFLTDGDSSGRLRESSDAHTTANPMAADRGDLGQVGISSLLQNRNPDAGEGASASQKRQKPAGDAGTPSYQKEAEAQSAGDRTTMDVSNDLHEGASAVLSSNGGAETLHEQTDLGLGGSNFCDESKMVAVESCKGKKAKDRENRIALQEETEPLFVRLPATNGIYIKEALPPIAPPTHLGEALPRLIGMERFYTTLCRSASMLSFSSAKAGQKVTDVFLKQVKPFAPNHCVVEAQKLPLRAVSLVELTAMLHSCRALSGACMSRHGADMRCAAPVAALQSHLQHLAQACSAIGVAMDLSHLPFDSILSYLDGSGGKDVVNSRTLLALFTTLMGIVRLWHEMDVLGGSRPSQRGTSIVPSPPPASPSSAMLTISNRSVGRLVNDRPGSARYIQQFVAAQQIRHGAIPASNTSLQLSIGNSPVASSLSVSGSWPRSGPRK